MPVNQLLNGVDPGFEIWPSGPFSGRVEFERLVRRVFLEAARQGWSEMVWCDASFLDWPLRERAVIEALQAWSTAGRRLTMLALQYDEVVRQHARFVSWRRTWSHVVECRIARAPSGMDLPSAIWSPAGFVRRVDPLRCVGISGCDRTQQTALREELNELIRNSTLGFPATVLGL